jgi:hypothetical protein
MIMGFGINAGEWVRVRKDIFSLAVVVLKVE